MIMTDFWSCVSAYNTDTWILQIAWVVLGIFLTGTLYFRPVPAIRGAMKVYMAGLNFWVAVIYYHLYGMGGVYDDMQTLFWIIMGGIWLYDLRVGHASLDLTGRHSRFALPLLAMPLVYPLLSLALGRSLPAIVSPLMPCSVAFFTIGVMRAFSKRVNIVLAMFLCHWALLGFSKVPVLGLPEDYLLAACAVPAIYLFARDYIRKHAGRDSKPSPRVLAILLLLLCAVISGSFVVSLVKELALS